MRSTLRTVFSQFDVEPAVKPCGQQDDRLLVLNAKLVLLHVELRQGTVLFECGDQELGACGLDPTCAHCAHKMALSARGRGRGSTDELPHRNSPSRLRTAQ